MAAIDFPNAPTVGQVHTVGTMSWSWTGTVWDAALPGTKISDTAPTNAVSGDIWYNSTEGRSYIYYGTTWVELSPGVAGPPGPTANIDDFTIIQLMQAY